jgi:hypothetical protein
MKMNYSTIKALAGEIGTSYKNLIALAPQNDPFYTGTDGDVVKAQWFAEIWRRAGYTGQAHLRRVHYWVVSQEPAIKLPAPVSWKPKGSKQRKSTDVYVNNLACWKYLCQAAKMARYLGLVAIADVADNKNPEPHKHAEYSASGLPRLYIEVPEIDDWYFHVSNMETQQGQPYHLEVWCEKSTMNDVLLPVCERYHANLVTFEGEVSITACYDLVQRAAEAGRPVRVFYISDFDPAGNSMPVAMSRKVEFIAQDFDGLDIRVDPLLLTAGQVDEYQLPRVPIKESETRAGNFEAAFGAGAVELDALEAIYPGELASLVDAALAEYFSEEAAEATRKLRQALEKEVQAKLAEITDPYKEQLEALRGMFEQMAAVPAGIDATQYKVEKAEPKADEANGWLFDSQRDYVDQLPYYKRHKLGVAHD